MSIDTTVQRKRAKERRTWRSEGRLTRASDGPAELDEDTGKQTPAAPELIYEGPCQVRLSAGGTGRRDAQAGEQEVRLSSLRAKVPHDVDARVDDWLEITASKFSENLVGRKFRVTDVLWKDLHVVTEILLEEVTP